MPLNPRFDPSDHHLGDRTEQLPGAEAKRPLSRTWEVAGGTLACPECDVPVMPASAISVAEGLDCPYCGHAGAVRDFLTLTDEPRPARVRVMARLAPASALRV